MNIRSDTEAAARAGMVCAGAMVAQQVGLKAARDTIFLSSFSVASLPSMLAASAIVSIVFVVLASRVMARVGPVRLMPGAFSASGALLVAEWSLARSFPRGVAVAVFLHVGTFGAILISGFWLLVSERFDPRTAKRRVGRIAAMGTLGGLLGALLVERVSAYGGVLDTLPVLAALHFVCAGAVRWLAPPHGPPAADPTGPTGTLADGRRSPLALVRRNPYLGSVALLVVAGSTAAAVMDYLFKAQAVAVYGQTAALMRFFAAFYAGVGLVTFALQALFGRLSLERLGLARTVASLPVAVAASGITGLLVPGLAAVTGMRGAEAVLRGSLYRLGYELLYTPVPRAQKRAAKTLIDVGLDRVGDVAGAGLVGLALVAAPAAAGAALATTLVLLGLIGVAIARTLKRGYVKALEQSLLSRVVELDSTGVADSATRAAALQTLVDLPLATEGPVQSALTIPVLGAANPPEAELFLAAMAPEPPSPARPPSPSQPAPHPADRLATRLMDLRSGEVSRVRRALAEEALDPLLVPQAIRLLAWNDVAADATQALRAVAPRIVGQLVDAMVDPDQPFAIRRRVPQVLGEARSPRALAGLVQGLEDRRFEVRFSCARALGRLSERDEALSPSPDAVVAAVLREAAVDQGVWQSRRLLDDPDDELPSSIGDIVRARSSRSLEHVFALLSFILPKEPLRVAFRGLQTKDEGLRGTALEYLESVLPSPVRDSLWPFLDDERAPEAPRRSSAQVLDDLMRSSATIDLHLSRD